MNILLLSFCLVAAATASAAELKDPAEVSKEWSETMEKSLAGQAAMPDLRSLSPNPFVFPERTFGAEPVRALEKKTAPREDRIIRPPGYDPKHIPKGAKSYEFNGKTYWLIPITNETDA